MVNSAIFVLCDLEISWMILKNNRAPLPYCFKLCASFHSHQWIQTKVTVRKCLIRVKISNFLSCVTLKFDGWPWKSIGHLFYATLSYVHHFSKPLVNSNWSYSPETLNSGKNRPFFSRVTLKFDWWPYKTIGHLFYVASSVLRHFIAIGEFDLELQSGNAQFESKSAIFCPVWPWNLMDDLEKQ